MTKRGKYREWLKEDNLKRIEEWARKGLVDEEIAHNMGIHPSTLYNWKNKYSEINEALKKGKVVIDEKVENSLLKNALGFEYEEEERIMYINADGSQTQRVKKVKKFAKPDTTAQIFWLKNRLPQDWRDRVEYTDTKSLDKLDKVLEAVKEQVNEPND